ncbi:MAG: radical SAM protein [Chloroflexota bacterium]
MRYFLAPHAALKWLETPCVYDIVNDELYELDERAFEFLRRCAAETGAPAQEGSDEAIGYLLSEGLVTADPVRVRRPLVMRSPVPSLRYLELQITDRCNLRCRHCYLGATEGHDLSMDQLKGVLRQFEELQGLRLMITGGEPLMHMQFWEFAEALPAYQFRKVLLTNGLLLRKDMLRSLHVDEIQFSVDGMKKGHDALRGAGTYERVMQKIRDAMLEGCTVSVATMIHSENLGEFDEMQRTFMDLGVKEWTVDVPTATGTLAFHPLLQVPPDLAGDRLRYGFGGGVHGGGEGYACGLHLAAVLSDGAVAKCGFYAHAASGRIRDGLRDVWARISPVDLKDLACAAVSCSFLDVCRGGCRYRAGIAAGEGIGPEISRSRDFCKCYEYGIMGFTGHEAGE